MPWILRTKGGEAIAIPNQGAGEVTIGRDAKCTIQVAAPAVSRIHCRLQAEANHVVLLAEGRNGTLVNGIRVGQTAHVGIGDVVEVDTEQWQVQRIADEQTEKQPHAFVQEDETTHANDPSKRRLRPDQVPSNAPSAGPIGMGGSSGVGRHPSPPRGGIAPRPPILPNLGGTASMGNHQQQQQQPLMPQQAVPPPPAHILQPAPMNAPKPSQPPQQPSVRPPAPTHYPPPLTAEVPTAVPALDPRTGQQRPSTIVPFEVEVVEDAAATTIRYRDAIRLADEHALLLMTDFAGNPSLTPQLLQKWKEVVRKAGSRGKGPEAVLRVLNQEFFDAGLQAVGTCARMDIRERLISIACAGTAPPFVVRSAGNRVARVQAAPSVALGRVRAAQFAEKSLHFDRGDTFLLPSASWLTVLESVFSQGQSPIPLQTSRAAEWLRHQGLQPTGGSLLCLALR